MSLFSLTTTLHYTQIGSGADVLLIHGWASSGRMWLPLMNAMAETARFWAVDLPGFGASPCPSEELPLNIDGHTAALLDFCEAQAIRPKVVMGHSMGGMLALKMALARPDLMESLVLMAPVVTGRFGRGVELNRVIKTEWGQAAAWAKPLWALAQSNVMDVFTPFLSMPWFAHRDASTRIRQDFKRMSWRAAAHILSSMAQENLGPRLGQIPHYTLVIVGAWDVTVPPEESRAAARRLPNGRLVELPFVYHQPLDESPRQVVEAVQAFLTQL